MNTDTLSAALRRFFLGEQHPEAEFQALARELFAYQYRSNAPYRAFCQGRGVSPETLSRWQEIPAAPAAAFKRFSLSCAPLSECTSGRGGRTFHSSGTTGAETSRHFMDAAALECYRASLKAGYRRFVGASGVPLLALMPEPTEAPHSSLSFMAGELIQEYGGAFFWRDNWKQALGDELEKRALPCVVFGTAFAFIHFFDASPRVFSLPAGSLIMETGGFKGRSREVSREELYRLFTERLGVPPSACLSEYGMSEMASQFYSAGEGAKQGPPWVRTRVLDPVTGEEAEPGKPGLLAHYDLANLNSVLALQTEDLGIAWEGGGFSLLGRAAGATLRGCSLLAEEYFSGG